jgi:CRP-like cAMP-binding protein
MVPLDVLKGIRFFQDLPDAHLTELGAIAELKEMPRGAVVFREGQTSPFIYLVIRGNVALEICAAGLGCAQIHTVGPGELLGWSPILGSGLMTATARVVSPTTVVAVHAAQLLAVCEHDPRFGMEIMRRTAQAVTVRLNATRLQLLDVFRQDLRFTPAEGGRA